MPSSVAHRAGGAVLGLGRNIGTSPGPGLEFAESVGPGTNFIYHPLRRKSVSYSIWYFFVSI